MINEKRIKEAEKNVQMYLTDGMLKKQSNETAKTVYLENSNLSLETAQKLIGLESPKHLNTNKVLISTEKIL